MGTVEGFQPVQPEDVGEGEGALEAAPGAVGKLYGTTTSPYTRKIRILTRAAGLAPVFVDTRTDDGAAALARVAPLGKVPVVALGAPASQRAERVLADSSLIAAWLWHHHGPALRTAGFSFSPDGWEDRALTVAVEGALDAAINRFYLLRDKLPDQGYVTRQGDRVTTTLTWLDAHMPAFSRPISPSTLSLGCALDWMAFRAMADVARFPRLAAFRDVWLRSGVGAGTEPG
jgi:glutathione S-transferase